MSAPIWIKQKDAEHNSVAVMQNLLHQLNVEVTDQTIEDLLKENPNYPSLASLSDSLSDLRIDNLAVRLDPEDLAEVSFPVIAHMQPPAKTAEEVAEEEQAGPSCGIDEEVKTTGFVMVSEVNESQVQYINTETGWVTEPKEVFFQRWSGIMLLVETKPESGDPNYKKVAQYEMIQKLKIPVVFTALGFLFLGIIATGIFLQGSVSQWLPLLVTKIGGSATCILLLTQLFDNENTLVNKVCNLGTGGVKDKQKSSNSGCGEGVLDSKAATLFGWLSMSEVGAFYFIGGLLTIVLGLLSNTLTSILYVLIGLNILALPYTIFSIYYQSKKARKWCKLCVAVQVILWLEFASGISVWSSGFESFNWHALTAVAWGFLLPAIAWSILKTGLGKEKQIKAFRKQLNIYRRNPAIIKDLLNKGLKVEMKNLPQEVVLGNPDSAFSVTVYSNPFCEPCQRAHQQLDRLLDEFGNEVRVEFRFSSQGDTLTVDEHLDLFKAQMQNIEDESMIKELKKHYGETPEEWRKAIEEQAEETDNSNYIALTLLAMAHLGNKETLHKAMTEWYNAEDKSDQAIAKWRKKYPVEKSLLEKMRPALRASNKWAREMKVPGTPSIFVNGVTLKNGVEFIPDLKYYIRAIEEEIEEKPTGQQENAEMQVTQPV